MNGLGVGIIGTGYGTRVILPCIRAAKGVRVTALVSRTPEKCEDIMTEYNLPNVFDSIDKMFEVDDVDIVCVATPPFLHKEMVEKSIAAGKNVLCEKPLALNISQAEEMCKLAQLSGRLHMIDHQLRFQPNVRKIKSILDEGTLGKIQRAAITYLTATRADPATPWDWWSDEDSGGGQLNALGSHYIDLLRWYFGKIISTQGKLETIIKEREFNGNPKAVTSDDYASFELQIENEITASVILSTVDADEPGIRIDIQGDKGSLLLEGFDTLYLNDSSGKTQDISVPDPLMEEPVIGINTWRRSLVRLLEHFAKSIVNNSPAEGATFFDGLKTQAVLDATRRSSKEGRRISIEGPAV